MSAPCMRLVSAGLQVMVDGGQRLPRLERLASALELSDFEKNVVVAMIGQVRPQPLACGAD